jgi:hypothetical protein
MKTEEAKALLQKYFEGNTSLTEEKELGNFLSKDALPEELAIYKDWFAGIRETEITRDATLENDIIRFLETQPVSKPAARRTWLYTWSGIAASVVIVAGSLLFYLTRPDFPDTFSDPAEAAAYAGKTLAFVSMEYNKGMSALAPVGSLRKAEPLEKSMKTIRKGFSEYNKIQLSNYLK